MALSLLLDSHAFVWFIQADPRCSHIARTAIEASDGAVFISAVTAWELSTKVRSGRWPEVADFALRIEDAMASCDFAELPITVAHGRVAGFMPGAHRDPFDRMLAAQALIEDLTLVTADPVFRMFGTRTLW